MYNYYKRLLKWSFYLSYILYGVTLIGFYKIAPEYLNTLNIFIKISVSLFLIIYFNPLSKHEFTDFDRRIVFTAGIFLLLTNAMSELTHSYINKQLFIIEKNINPN